MIYYPTYEDRDVLLLLREALEMLMLTEDGRALMPYKMNLAAAHASRYVQRVYPTVWR